MAELPCPKCGNELTFLDQYHRYYCHRCGQYAPEGYGDGGAKVCPTCGGILSFVAAYNRFYCYRCNAYAPPEVAEAKPADTTAPSAATQAAPAAAAPILPVSAPSDASQPSPAAAAALSPPSTPAGAQDEHALAATTTPPAITVAPESAPQETPKPEAKPEEGTPTAEAALTSTAGTPEPAAETPKEPETSPPSPPMRALAASKPAVVRVKIFSLKKPELVDLCKAYGLDPSGTKEQLQERLLSYLHDLEAGEPGEAAPEATVPGWEEMPSVPAAELPTAAEPGPVKAEESTAPRASAAIAASAQPALVAEEKPAISGPVLMTAASAPAVVEVPKPTPHAEHPCPTCGRELSFIAQYNRWYCYFCQRYAPAAKSKNACPTCGATMRWIDQHQRWWCDACQKYASADLPPPSGAVAPKPAAAAEVIAPQVTARPAFTIHHHGSAGTGIGLIGFGLALYIIVEFFATLAPLANLAINNPFTAEMAALTEFFAILFIAAGAMVGLWSMRDRP